VDGTADKEKDGGSQSSSEDVDWLTGYLVTAWRWGLDIKIYAYMFYVLFSELPPILHESLRGCFPKEFVWCKKTVDEYENIEMACFHDP
jgi:hypothetical protein